MTLPGSAASEGWRTLPPDEVLRALLTAPDLPAALERLGAAPRALSRLDEWMRGYHRRPPTVTGLAATVVDSMHRDGRVRESAVAAMIAHGSRATVPFVVLRSGDWVPQIRIRARRGLATLLASDPAGYLPAALPIAAYLERRYHGGWAMDHIRAVARASFEVVAPELLRARGGVARRLAYESGTWTYEDQVRFALREKDMLVRMRAADAACAEAESRADTDTLRVLAGSRYTTVHVSAAIALVRLGTDVPAALDDRSPLVRAYARTRFSDPVAHYRAVVASAPTPGGVAGLGETGRYADEPLLTPLLTHPDPAIRAAALTALAALDVVPEAAFTLLLDPAAGVARTAATVLRPYRKRLPHAIEAEIADSPHRQVRRLAAT
ncbi:hypothetical protein HH310_18325 [Actinoplanes sp. TBRC 11911]|uniref:hypothetical protein n=1 Tax=Actinoplanes sp. TBRC 11911 TaxID=2729386 RepID=UPI00145DFD15|nr:hypothetical protein [Actinoplanes sp. TBRC 11911]NMO53140.1 hypothetical protein [Actinoplanes sp. TBRC 11911]